MGQKSLDTTGKLLIEPHWHLKVTDIWQSFNNFAKCGLPRTKNFRPWSFGKGEEEKSGFLLKIECQVTFSPHYIRLALFRHLVYGRFNLSLKVIKLPEIISHGFYKSRFLCSLSGNYFGNLLSPKYFKMFKLCEFLKLCRYSQFTTPQLL